LCTALTVHNERVGQRDIYAEEQKTLPPFLGGDGATIMCPKLIIHINAPHLCHVQHLHWNHWHFNNRLSHVAVHIEATSIGSVEVDSR
jgi:hypothetical protein